MNSTYLVVANSHDNAGNTAQDVVIYGWHAVRKQFRPIQTIRTVDVQKVHAFTAESDRGMLPTIEWLHERTE